jgi:hypothetical protein
MLGRVWRLRSTFSFASPKVGKERAGAARDLPVVLSLYLDSSAWFRHGSRANPLETAPAWAEHLATTLRFGNPHAAQGLLPKALLLLV